MMIIKNSGKYFIFIVFVFAILSLSACKKEENAGRNSRVTIIRYDKMVLDIDTAKIKSSFDNLYRKFPGFTDIYFEKIVPLAGYKSDSILFYNELKRFVTDTVILEIEDMVKKRFGDMKDLESEFQKAFNKMVIEFPDAKIPSLYSYISAFAIQRFIFEDRDRDGLAFGADLFLGDYFPYTKLEHGQNTFSNYLVRTYNKQHLVKKVLELWIDDKIGNPSGNRAIDAMIKNGKKLYVLKRIMPEIQDSVLFEYTPSQLEWLDKNEREMWNFYIENNLFYTTDSYKIKRLTSSAPNSQALGMPKKSPGNTGSYLGYKIVKEFMKRSKEMSIKKLIDYKDSQKLMEKSRFKPKIY